MVGALVGDGQRAMMGSGVMVGGVMVGGVMGIVNRSSAMQSESGRTARVLFWRLRCFLSGSGERPVGDAC